MRLDDLIGAIHGEVDYDRYKTCGARTEGATTCPSCCRAQYRNGLLPTYDCEQKRKIYVLRYLPTYSFENYRGAALIPDDVSGKIFSKAQVNVLSIGGGPGSDMAGFRRYLSTLDQDECPCKDFKMVRFDREDGWAEISKRVNALYREQDREFDHKYVTLDVSAKSDWFERWKFDVALISYLISELNDGQIAEVARNLSKCLAKDSVIIVNDRDEECVNQRVSSLSKQLNLTELRNKFIAEHTGYFYDDEIKHKAEPTLSASSRIHLFLR